MASPLLSGGASIAGGALPWWANVNSALGKNSNLLLGLGAGLLSGNLSEVPQAIAQGSQADTAYAASKKADLERQQSINKTMQAMQAKYPDLAAAVNGGLPIADAYNEMFKRMSPDYANGGAGRGTTADIMNYEYGQKHPDFLAAQQDQSLSSDALDLIATQYLAGDKTVISGYARNPQLKALIANKIAEKANAAGMDGNAIAAQVSAYGGNVAAQRSAGTRAAQVGMAASEANQMADIALDASAKVPRGNFMPWNAAVNAYNTNTSSPEMAAFVTATTSLVNAYARAVSPLGAPTDAMRQHAEAMLNTAQSPEAYAAVIAQMKKEMEAALNAPTEISKQLKSNITGGAEQGGVYDPEVENILKGVGL